MKNTERFTDRAAHYVKYRPHYPEAIVPFLQQHAGLRPEAVVADIGAGTGISSQLFLDNGNKVFAVEPNKAMREMAVQSLRHYPNCTIVDGTAEHTTLPDASVDHIIAGQAFHWFMQDEARAEFRRIARSNCHVTLVWNERQTSTAFERDYETLIHKYAIDYRSTGHRNIHAAQLADFYAPYRCMEHTFRNAQVFDLTALKGRWLSSSYMPNADHPSYTAMMQDLEELFEHHQQQGMVKLHYATKLYTGLIRDH